MVVSNSQRWVLIAALSLGAGAVPRLVAAKEHANVELGTDERVKYEAIPGKARGEFERMRANSEVFSSEKVTYADKRVVYRVTLKVKGGGLRVLRVSVGGSMLSDEFVRPADVAAYEKDPNGFHARAAEADAARAAALARADAAVTATPDHPEKVSWDQIPGRVRATFMRESVGEKIDYIIRYRDNQKNIIYQANIPMENGKVHMVQLTPRGKIFNEAAFTTEGGKTAADLTVTTVAFHSTPPAVQEAVNKAMPTGRITQVEVAKRRGHDVYTVENDEPNGVRFLTVQDTGKILSDDMEKF